jgi:NADPH:quinone reductase
MTASAKTLLKARWIPSACAADGTLRVSIGARYPLEQAADAHAAIESWATTGKVILLP